MVIPSTNEIEGALPEPRPFSPLRSAGVFVLGFLGAVGGVFGALIGVAILGGFGIGPGIDATSKQPASVVNTVSISLMELCAAGVVFAFLPGLSRKSYRELGFVAPSWRTVGAGIAGTVAIFAFEAAYRFLLASTRQSHHVQAGFEHFRFGSIASVIVGYVGLCVVAPICEETFFRGFVLNALAANVPFWVALFLNGCLFSVLHGDLVLAPTFVVFGMVNGYIYRRTGSIVAPIVAHALNNAVATTAFYQMSVHHAHAAART